MVFFVGGITGQVGSVVATTLLEEGKKVRALFRSAEKAAAWTAKGVEAAIGDLTDSAALAKALKGVEGAFVFLPPSQNPKDDFPDSKLIIASYKSALEAVPVSFVVLLSSIGAELESGSGLIMTNHLLETAFQDISIPTIIVRAGAFIENNSYGVKYGPYTGTFNTFNIPVDKKYAMIASADIGKEVAKRLLSGKPAKKTIVELSSPVSANDLAEAMTKVTGQTIVATPIPREGWSGFLEQSGAPPGTTGKFEEMMDAQNSELLHFGLEGTEKVAGTTTPLEVFQGVKKGLDAEAAKASS
eukprot:TRINITY_DN35762_c0_g1_i1.p1 TRINITY_DN35762_c0_g1~~TRINITY_DN35762_c0_g1_i1.p1  ORF type:complete len:300 (+),score=66.24 TRINITY_DN35762_c0_g1_i1:169-1068(+)